MDKLRESLSILFSLRFLGTIAKRLGVDTSKVAPLNSLFIEISWDGSGARLRRRAT